MRNPLLILFALCALSIWNAGHLVAAPEELAISHVNASATPEAITVTWFTNVPANSRVDWGTAAGNLPYNKADAAYLTNHSMTITGLTPGTVYYIVITSVTEQGQSVRYTVSQPQPAPAPPPPPPATVPPPVHHPASSNPFEHLPHLTAYVGAGFTIPVGTSDTNQIQNRLDYGWNVMGGVGPRWGAFSLPVDFGYSRMNTKNYIPGLNIDGNMGVWNLTLNPTVTLNPHGRVGLYFTGGYGLYSRRLQIVRWDYEGGVVCDPWWGFCWGGTYPVGNILGEHTTYKGGWNAGVGVTIGGPFSGKFFVESRFHQMLTDGASTTYVPITFGFRF